MTLTVKIARIAVIRWHFAFHRETPDATEQRFKLPATFTRKNEWPFICSTGDYCFWYLNISSKYLTRSTWENLYQVAASQSIVQQPREALDCSSLPQSNFHIHILAFSDTRSSRVAEYVAHVVASWFERSNRQVELLS